MKARIRMDRLSTLAGIAGSLMAFVSKLSVASGFDGYLSFEAKTELISHYETAFGARRIGRSQRMVIDEFAAKRLIAEYFGESNGSNS